MTFTEDRIVERTAEVSLQRECPFRTGEKEKQTHMQSAENPDGRNDFLARTKPKSYERAQYITHRNPRKNPRKSQIIKPMRIVLPEGHTRVHMYRIEREGCQKQARQI